MTQTMTDQINQNPENSKKFDFNKIKPIMQKALNSVWMLAVVSFLIAFCWSINFPYVSIGFLLLYEVAVFTFCADNPKPIIMFIISIPYIITSVYGLANWIFYISCVVFFIAVVTTYILMQKFKYKKTFKKGKMFWFFVLCLVGNCLGGIIGHFALLEFTITLLMSILVYGIYWFFLNFIKDYKKYIAYCFIFLTLLITFELAVAYIKSGDILYALQNKYTVTIGIGEVNTAAIFMLSGICSCFYLATKNKKDYLYILLALFFDIAVYFTLSRMALLLAAVISVVYFFIILKSSPNKKPMLIGVFSIIGVVALISIIWFEKIINLVSYYLNLGFQPNGRSSLWGWCWEQFKNNPIFGIGFVTRDPQAVAGVYPGMGDATGFGSALVNCHNFFLHYLTCTGVVGLLLSLPYYVKQYTTLFKKFNTFKLFILFNYVAVFISSLFDPSPNISILSMIPVLILMAFAEDDNELCCECENKNESEEQSNNSVEVNKTEEKEETLTESENNPTQTKGTKSTKKKSSSNKKTKKTTSK